MTPYDAQYLAGIQAQAYEVPMEEAWAKARELMREDTREVKETKVRWEARAGQLQRHYDNVPAPALDEIAGVRSRLGSFDREAAVAYQQEMLADGLVRLPIAYVSRFNRDQAADLPLPHTSPPM